jgi:hypothetical protein
MGRSITVTVKFCLPEGVRETTDLKRLGMAEDPRHRNDDTNKVRPITGYEGPEGE